MPEPTFLNDRYIRTTEVLDLIKRVLRRLLLATGAIAVVALGVGVLVAGVSGVWSALLAAAIGIGFTATTVLALYLVAGRGPEVLQVVLLGGWIVKMGLLALVLLWLREQEFYDKGVFLVTLILLVLVAVSVELVTIATAKIPYVDPTAQPASTDRPQAAPGDAPEAAQAPPAETADPSRGEVPEEGSAEGPERP